MRHGPDHEVDSPEQFLVRQVRQSPAKGFDETSHRGLKMPSRDHGHKALAIHPPHQPHELRTAIRSREDRRRKRLQHLSTASGPDPAFPSYRSQSASRSAFTGPAFRITTSSKSSSFDP